MQAPASSGECGRHGRSEGGTHLPNISKPARHLPAPSTFFAAPMMRQTLLRFQSCDAFSCQPQIVDSHMQCSVLTKCSPHNVCCRKCIMQASDLLLITAISHSSINDFFCVNRSVRLHLPLQHHHQVKSQPLLPWRSFTASYTLQACHLPTIS